MVRIGVDAAYGQWNSPCDTTTRRFVYVPIPEYAGFVPNTPECARYYSEIEPSLAKFGAPLPSRLLQTPMHLDPDFDYLTYGDLGNRRASEIKSLHPGDLLVFYAGLAPLPVKAKELVYAIVGMYTIAEIVAGHDVVPSRWGENAHTRRANRNSDDVIVRAKPGESGRCVRYIPIGEWRNNAYRVRHDLLEGWGGLSVRDGYIQRSARPPRFLKPTQFVAWWERQEVQLVQSNW